MFRQGLKLTFSGRNNAFIITYNRSRFKRIVISSELIKSPLPEPGQTFFVSSQSSGVPTVLSQNGHVRHCTGLISYIVQPLLSLKYTQSPFAFSRKVYRPLAFLALNCLTSSKGSLVKSAIACISSSVTHTYPGSPVQQLPHCVHLNFRPSLYHGSSVLIKFP